MTSKILAKGIVRAVLTLTAIICLAYFLFVISNVIIYCIISLILTLLLYPIVNFLKTKLKFKNGLAVATTILLFILFTFGLIAMFIPLIINEGENLSLIDIKKLELDYYNFLTQSSEYLSKYNIDIKELILNSKLDSFSMFKFIPTLLNNIVAAIGNFGIGYVSVIFITFFILNQKQDFAENIKYILPSSKKEKIINSVRKIQILLSKYFMGLLIQLSIIFVLYLIVFLIFGVENAFIIAILCALLNIIPYLGPIIAVGVALIIHMSSGIALGHDFGTEIINSSIYILIGMFLVQFIDNNISSPIIFSKSTDSHPLEIFLVILATGSLFGITGMIIAVPFYTSLKVIGKEFYPDNKIIKLLTKDY